MGSTQVVLIDLLYDASASAAPAAFKTALAYAAQFLDTLITNAITVSIQVGYGEDSGQPLPSTALGEGGPTGVYTTYSQLKNELVANAKSTTAEQAVGTLPTSDPTPGGNGRFFMSTAEEKAWGLLPANGTEIDGSVGFSSTANFDYSTTNRAVAGEYDFFGVAEHELTHALGRVIESDAYSALYLYRYSAPGIHQLYDGGSAYFSIDGGSTNLNNFATVSDYADWGAGAGHDSFSAVSSPGLVNSFTTTDITVMDALGFNATGLNLVLNLQNVSISANTSIPASSLIASISNPAGDSITLYGFWDGGGGNGHFSLNGAIQPDGQWIDVSPSNLNDVQYVGGSAPGSEPIQIEAYDATIGNWSAYSTLTATTGTSTGSQSTLVAPLVNTLIQGAGYDSLNFTQNPIATASSSYTATSNLNGTFTLATNGSSDLVSGVIQIEFSDKTVTVAINASENEYIALLYQGAVGRTPDAAGLAGWEQIGAALPASAHALGVYGLSDASAGFNGNLSVAAGFTNSNEFLSKYGSLTNAQFVTQLYANTLDRAPDKAGFDGWMALLNMGETREHVLVGFADSAEAITNATVGFTGQSGAHPSWLFLT